LILDDSTKIDAYLDTATHPDEGVTCECGGSFMTAEQDFSDATNGFDVYWPEGHD
jgi:hypothetical protein